MERVKQASGKVLAVFLCVALAVWGGVSSLSGVSQAYAANIGANPKPKVDIAVSVPSDYQGDFNSFKAELTQALIEQGMDPSTFRITDTAVKIDTTDTSNWVVYDHYRDQATYNSVVPTAEQRALQPFRQADNSNTNGTGTIESYFKDNTNTTGNKCKKFDRHIYSFQDSEGKASMVFTGYGKDVLSDYMIYPASSDSRRTISFDINPAVIDTHTLGSYGFLLNAGIKDGKLQGYSLYFTNAHAPSIQKINLDVNSGTISGGTVKALGSMGIKSGDIVRLQVELSKDKVSVSYQNYDGNGVLGSVKELVKDQPLDPTGFNGFGPFVNYTSHNCGSLSIMKYSDLVMTYDATAFDALKTVQYYNGAEQKYFINLVGANNNPQIPEEFKKDGTVNDAYADGVNRMASNNIFYISNVEDGQVVTDSHDNHQGLGANNGHIATDADYVTDMAKYIYENYTGKATFDSSSSIKSNIPLASFWMKNSATEDDQLMTVHLQHLKNDGTTVKTRPVDTSKTAATGSALTKWTYKVYDPDGAEVINQMVTNPNDLPDYEFTGTSKPGRYTFELTVADADGKDSKVTQTYITAFRDEVLPEVKGENTARNVATITLTDRGQGIDEDGITFIEENRGSGIAAYWVTNSETDVPTEEDWEYIDVTHSYAFDVEISSKEPIVVHYKDECGNQGAKAVFKPVYVEVQDEDGNPIDDYYVIGENPIIVVPDEAPDSSDEDNEFAGWVTPDGDDVTPGNVPKPDEDNTIIIRPNYSKDTVDICYLANGGTIKFRDGGVDKTAAYRSFPTVTAGAAIQSKIDAQTQNFTLTREGYSFAGWKLISSDNNAAADALVDRQAGTTKASDNMLVDPSDKVANMVLNDPTNPDSGIKLNKYYLVAQWVPGIYKISLNANGGALGSVKSIEDIKFDTALSTIASKLPSTGRAIPDKAGYIFKGWSATKNGTVNDFTSSKMPSNDLVLYAVWQKDPSKYVYSFDPDGGSPVLGAAYDNSNLTLKEAPVTNRPGYTFEGWFLVDAEGNMTATPYPAVGSKAQQADMNYRAKWTPNAEGTKYTVDYYFNNGGKDKDGNPSYSKANTDTVKSAVYTAGTGAEVSIPETDYKDSITIDGVDYWYNPDNTRNVFSGTVTGSPALSLRLYFDRYLTVKGAAQGDGGSVQAPGNVKEGDTPTVTWKADSGYTVKQVYIDGILHDDLARATSYTFDAVHDNHEVSVVFEKASSGSKPVTPTNPDAPVYYNVETSVTGDYAGACKITPSTSVAKGATHTVSWTVGKGYEITGLAVDGVAVTDEAQLKHYISDGSITFNQINGNHLVNITVGKLPSIGGKSTFGLYTVTVNRYGGDSTCQVSSSGVVEANTNYPVTWTPGEDYEVYKVIVDGKEKTLKGSYNVPVGTKNHVVDIYFGKKDAEVAPSFKENVKVTTKIEGYTGTITPSAMIEKASDQSKNYLIDWNMDLINNTEGERVNGALDNSGQSQDNTYSKYEIDKVTIDGRKLAQDEYTVSEDGGNLTIPQVEKDTDVVVHVKADTYDVATALLPKGQEHSGGAVSKSLKLFKGQDYYDIQARPAQGRELVEVILNGRLVWSLVPEKEPEAKDPETAAPAAAEPAAEPAAAEPAATEPAVAEPAAAQANEPETTPKAAEESKANTKADDEKAVDTSAAESAASAANEDDDQPAAESDKAKEPASDEKAATDTPPVETAAVEPVVEALALEEFGAPMDATTFDYEIIVPDHVPLYGKTYSPLTGLPMEQSESDKAGTVINVDKETGNVTLSNVHSDATVLFVTAEKDTYTPNEDGTSVTNPKSVQVHYVDAEGNNIAQLPVDVYTYDADESSANVNWTVPTGYELTNVKIGDTMVTDNPKSRATAVNLNGTNHVDVFVTLAPALDGSLKGDPKTDDDVYTVKTKMNGPEGCTITGTSTKTKGNPSTVEWAIPNDLSNPQVLVFVDGKLANTKGNKVTFEDNKNHTVSVVVWSEDPETTDPTDPTDPDNPDDPKTPDTPEKPKVPVNIDTDADGEPDVNVDTDGDGEPDVNVDTDGDYDPDVNKDTDGDGKPDTDVDTDGDGEPDLNRDTDGDGKPDVDIVDEDGDGKPDPVDPKDPKKPNVNVDTDGDDKPDVNKDTDGDGKPDVDIVDTDGDGKPDPVDPYDPNTPNPNPPKPNVNVDTDKDGKPDLNRDTDGDGKPDVDIVDEDGDGKPDPIDPTKPAGEQPKPNVNVDTDGDGKPDVNVDTDKDGKPDLNIVDTDGDGKPDPVDPKDPNAPKPNVNVDTDGDNKPDLNIDTDGDGKPDANIDTDGDGKPDKNLLNPDNPDEPAAQADDKPSKNDAQASDDDKPAKDEKDSKASENWLTNATDNLLSLAQTGDPMALTMIGVLVVALAGGVVALIARRKTHKKEDK